VNWIQRTDNSMLRLSLKHLPPRLDIALPQIQSPLFLRLIRPVGFRHQVWYLRVSFSGFKNGPLGDGDDFGRDVVGFGFRGVDDFYPVHAGVERAIFISVWRFGGLK
jgi:hypothetical protein